MPLPADAFSLSWHSGCDGSDLPLPWNPLSRHCSTDRSSSLGSMESLEPPGQTYLEGSLSPVDQAADQSKRDSAYSSFSASSNASDSALRPEEGSAGDGPPPGQPPDPRYLQTGGGEPVHPLASRSASCTPEGSSHPARAPGPPQPPVRQDSLQACHSPPQRASSQADPPQSRGRWTSDTSLCVRSSRDPKGQDKEPPPGDQYYLLSSHMEKGAQAAEESGGPLPEEPAQRVAGGEAEARPGSPDSCPSPPWRGECWPGLLGHRHSAPEHLLAAQLQALDVAHGQEGAPCWTVSPLHQEPRGPRASEPWQDREAQEPGPRPAPGEGARGSVPSGRQAGLEGPRSASTQLAPARLPQPPADAAAVPGGGRDAAEGQAASRKGGPAPQRSAQARRRSDRFATNLRQEIQWRKAQLQRGKGAPLLPGGEEPVQEAGEPPEAPARPPPTPARAPAESRPRSPAPPPRTAPPPKRWGSELSLLQADRAGQRSPAPGPQWQSPLAEAQRPPKTLPLPRGGGGGRWRWSPEHKLQPQGRGLPAATPGSPAEEEEEEGGLLPFSERRRFFEETSRPPPPAHLSPLHGRPAPSRAPRGVEQGPCQAGGCGCRDQRRHSVDQAYAPPSPPPLCPQDFLRAEAPPCHQPLGRRGDWECWRPPPCSCAAARDPPCACCGADRCPALLQRNLSMPAGHPGHHCPPRCWTRCHRDCCCPTRHSHLEDGTPWHARRTFQAECPVAEWEPPAINRKSSQSMSELAQLQAGFARAGPFWPGREGIGEPEWAPVGRAASTHSLAWDCERPGQAAFEEGAPGEPRKPPLRERAYSESHLPAGSAGAAARERRDTPLARLEEAELESPPTGRKKGPPPPRPPPPNWEKYRPRRASHHQLLASRGGPAPTPEDARAPAPSPTAVEVARQRSQSLPLEQLWQGAPWQESPSPAEHGPPHYCHRGSARGTTAWPAPDPRDRGSSSRPGGSPEEDGQPEPRWDQGPTRAASRTPEQPPSSASGRAPPGQEAPQEAAPPLRPDSEELMRDVAGRDRALAGVLSPTRGLVTAAELMGGLFAPGECPAWQGQDWQPQAGGTAFPGRQPTSPTPVGAASPTSCSAYYSLSAGKAELLNKMKALPEPAGASSEEEGEEDRDLARKKVQLIESISRKLAVLQEAQRGLQEDVGANLALGREVEGHVQRVCKPQECEKFRLFLGDLDKVVNLLLSLSGRLARVENALGGLGADTPEEEKLALLEKKRQLLAQLEDAKELQEHVARRERLVFACVSRCLPREPLQDYQHFVRMKSALAVQQRQLEDKIKLGEEQLRCLRESLRRAHRDY